MTVKEFLKEKKGYIVNLGFGSSFVFCEYVDDDTLEEVGDLSGAAYQNLIRLRHETEQKLARLLQLGKERYIEKKIDVYKREHLNRDPGKHRIETWGEDFDSQEDSLRASIQNFTDHLEEFVPFLEATVDGYYESTCDSNTLICVGAENQFLNGNFWFIEEYRRWKYGKDKLLCDEHWANDDGEEWCWMSNPVEPRNCWRCPRMKRGRAGGEK